MFVCLFIHLFYSALSTAELTMGFKEMWLGGCQRHIREKIQMPLMMYAKYEINHFENTFIPLEYTFLLLFAFGPDLHNKELSVMN